MFNYIFDVILTIFYYWIWKPCRQRLRRCRVGLLRPRRPAQPPPHEGQLYHLAPELMLEIADKLPPGDQVMLARTCLRIRCILKTHTATALHALARRPPKERIEFLSLAAQDWADRWCCELCVSLHPVFAYEQPGLTEGYRDPFVDTSYSSRHNRLSPMDNSKHTSGSTNIRHCHVQLALKYARMQEKGTSDADFCFYHKYYLRRVLSPIRPHVSIGFDSTIWSVSAPAVFKPKIVPTETNSPHPYRFLVQSEFRDMYRLHELSARGCTHVAKVCPHLGMDYRVQQRYEAGFFPSRMDPPFLDWEGARHLVCCHSDTDTAKRCTDKCAIYSVGCRLCPTEFDLKTTSLYAYHDFGTEGPPTALQWQMNLPGLVTGPNVDVEELKSQVPHDVSLKNLYLSCDGVVNRTIDCTVSFRLLCCYFMESLCWDFALSFCPGRDGDNFWVAFCIRLAVHWAFPRTQTDPTPAFTEEMNRDDI